MVKKEKPKKIPMTASEMGKKGGKANFEKYGSAEMKKRSKKALKARWG